MILSHLADDLLAARRGQAFYATNSGAGNVWLGGVFQDPTDADWDRRWTGTTWETHDTVFGLAFPGGFDLWAGGTAQVWYYSGRALWQYTGSAWQTDLSLTNGSSGFFAGRSASDLYCLLGGTQSGIGVLNYQYWDGSAWTAGSTPVNYPTASGYNVHARPSSMMPDGTLYAGMDLQARFGGLLNATFVAYLDSGAWQPGLVLDTGRVLTRVWAADTSTVFVISTFTGGGDPEYILWQGSGTTWAPVALPTAPAGHRYRWTGVHGAGPDAYWVVGEDETVAAFTSDGLAAFWDGSGFTLYTIPHPGDGYTLAFNTVTWVASNDVWVAADAGSPVGYVPAAYHWDGTAWAQAQVFS
jgi:hypothetical protein